MLQYLTDFFNILQSVFAFVIPVRYSQCLVQVQYKISEGERQSDLLVLNKK